MTLRAARSTCRSAREPKCWLLPTLTSRGARGYSPQRRMSRRKNMKKRVRNFRCFIRRATDGVRRRHQRPASSRPYWAVRSPRIFFRRVGQQVARWRKRIDEANCCGARHEPPTWRPDEQSPTLCRAVGSGTPCSCAIEVMLDPFGFAITP